MKTAYIPIQGLNSRKEHIIKGYFMVSKCDEKRVAKHYWNIQNQGYIQTKIKGQTMKLGRFILKAKEGQVIDHINHNLMDNTRENLRLTNASGNCQNRRKQRRGHTGIGRPTSQYKGVFWVKSKKKYKASICVNKKSYFLGYFDDEKEAAVKYNEAAIKYHKTFAMLNHI